MSTSHTFRAHAQEVRTKIKDGCQLGRKVVSHNSKTDLPLAAQGSEARGHRKEEATLL